MSSLHDKLLAAHAAGDGMALVVLYTQAADETNDVDAACFFLTHAYVYALEWNHSSQDTLHERLRREGRI